MSKRSQQIVLTNEARVLRALRIEHRLSMREAGSRAGVSDSTIAHIETGRMNPPKGEALYRLLGVYGDIKPRSFQERVRTWKERLTPKDELSQLVERANPKQIEVLLHVAKGLLT